QHLVVIAVRALPAEDARRLLGALLDDVAASDELDVLPGVRLGEVGEDAALGHRAEPRQRYADLTLHAACSLWTSDRQDLICRYYAAGPVRSSRAYIVLVISTVRPSRAAW